MRWLQKAAFAYYDWRATRFAARADAYLLQPFVDYPAFRPAATLVCGSGVVSAEVALHVADLAARDAVGDVLFFAGGLNVRRCPFADILLPQLAAKNVMMPEEGEAEGPYMRRVFDAALRERDVDPSRFVIHVEDQSPHTQAHMRNNLDNGLLSFDTIGFAALPYAMRRIMGTWLQFGFEAKAMMPMMAWPHHLGITPENWMDNPIARIVVAEEYFKIAHPKPERAPYVRKKYCASFHVSDQAARAALQSSALALR